MKTKYVCNVDPTKSVHSSNHAEDQEPLVMIGLDDIDTNHGKEGATSTLNECEDDSEPLHPTVLNGGWANGSDS